MSTQTPTVPVPRVKLRCAVYTRKSSEEGLEMEFNSLDAQREACEAYVASQRAEGWVLVADRYDDGGFSGGTLERPALKRLRADIEAGKVDVVVVYKIDRLSRSLMDFSRLVEVFDQHKVTFVSVTQSFNTTTSMGRLTLNVLLSFAQFEREVIGERIRDKFAASRKRGMWMGGWAPLGYEVKERKLIVNEVDAKLVRSIFQRFLKTGSATTLARELIAEDVRNKYGKLIDKGILYKMLSNPVYVGVAVHKGVSWFALWFFACHWIAASYTRLTLAQSRSIDYVYLGVASVGVFVLAMNYEEDRYEYTQNQYVAAARVQLEKTKRDLDTALVEHQQALCQLNIVTSMPEYCTQAKQLVQDYREEDRTKDTPDGSRAITLYMLDVRAPKDADETKKQLYRIVENELLNLRSAQLSVINGMLHIEVQTPMPREREGETHSAWQVFTWPFILAFALALRLTRTTIEVLDWTRRPTLPT